MVFYGQELGIPHRATSQGKPAPRGNLTFSFDGDLIMGHIVLSRPYGQFWARNDGPGNFLLFPIHLAAQEAQRQMGRASSLLGLQRYTQRWKRSGRHRLHINC